MGKKSDNKSPKYLGKRVTTNGSLLVSDLEGLISEAGVFYPITPSTEMGENFQNLYSKGKLNAFGKSLIACAPAIFDWTVSKAWRLLQSKAGIISKDYQYQKDLLAKIDKDGKSVSEALTELESV